MDLGKIGLWGLYGLRQNRLWGLYGLGLELNRQWGLHGKDKLGGTDVIFVESAFQVMLDL